MDSMDRSGFVQFRISYRGKIYELEKLVSDSLRALAEHLKHITDVNPDTIKLILPKGRRSSPGKSTPTAVQPMNAEWQGSSLGEAGIMTGMTILMSGASTAEVAAVSKPSASGTADFDYEEKRARQRARRSRVPRALPTGPYVFAEFRTLQLPGVTLHPPAAKALKLLHRLASDPGIVAIMNKYKWRVGIMTELAPEGYVGVSPVCLLGFNRNRGMEISLRLRTDDLAGFRKYDSIRQTLLHELTHMVHDDHDEKFKALNSQLKREAEELDWTRKTGHTLGGGAVVDSEDESESSDEEVGKVLGGRAPNASVMDPRAAAAAAAMRRDEEKRRQEAEGQPTADVADDVIMDEAGGSREGAETASGFQGSVGSSERPTPEIGSQGSRDAVDGLQEEEKGVGVKGKQKLDEEESFDVRKESDEILRDAPRAGVEKVGSGTGSGAAEEFSEGPRSGLHSDGLHRSTDASTVRSEPDPDGDPDDSNSPASLGRAENGTETAVENPLEQNPAAASNTPQSEPMNVDGHFVGLSEAAPTEEASRGSEPGVTGGGEAVTTSGSGAEVPNGSGAEVTGGGDGEADAEWRRAQAAAAEASGRVQKAVADLKRQAGPGEVSLTLKTLATILRNVMEHPAEAKYRRVRKSNAAFFERVGKFQAALEVLQAAGFRDDSASDAMVLQRDDPGLLWLTCSLVEGSLA